MTDYDHWMRVAYRYAALSADPSTQNGALILDENANVGRAASFNHIPLGLTASIERWDRPTKHAWVEHAERSAIYEMARRGIATAGLTMVCPWAACAECARAIIESDIDHLVVHGPAMDHDDGRWSESIELGHQMLREAGVEIHVLSEQLNCNPIRRDGQLFQP